MFIFSFNFLLKYIKTEKQGREIGEERRVKRRKMQKKES